MLLWLMAAAAGAATDVAAIRAARARSNAAIAMHQFDDMRPLLLPDYVLLAGSLGKAMDVEEAGRRLAIAFAEPGFVTYVRTPRRIVRAASGKRASETGTWIGTWRKADGTCGFPESTRRCGCRRRAAGSSRTRASCRSAAPEAAPASTISDARRRLPPPARRRGPPHHRAPPGPAGHYRLAGGPDVASEILLRPDGRFQFFLMEGAVDEQAAGPLDGARQPHQARHPAQAAAAGVQRRTGDDDDGGAAQAPGRLARRARHRHHRPAGRLRFGRSGRELHPGGRLEPGSRGEEGAALGRARPPDVRHRLYPLPGRSRQGQQPRLHPHAQRPRQRWSSTTSRWRRRQAP